MIVLSSIYFSFFETWACHSKSTRTEHDLIMFNFRGGLLFPLFVWKPLMQYRRPPRKDFYDIFIQRFTYTESDNMRILCYCLEKNFKSFITSIS